MPLEFLQQGFGGAQDVSPATLLQELHVLFGDHAAVPHPHAVRAAVTRLHPRDDVLHRGHVGRVAGEDVVAQIRHDPRPRPALGAIRLDQRPIRVTLAILPAITRSNKQAPCSTTANRSAKTKGLHYNAISATITHRSPIAKQLASKEHAELF